MALEGELQRRGLQRALVVTADLRPILRFSTKL